MKTLKKLNDKNWENRSKITINLKKTPDQLLDLRILTLELISYETFHKFYYTSPPQASPKV